LHLAPRVVIRRSDHPTRVVQRLADTAERIAGGPDARATGHPIQSIHAVDILVGAIAEDLAERGSEILGVARGDTAGRLGDERTIAVIGIARRAAHRQAIERVVRRGAGAIVEQIPRTVVGSATHLIGRIVAASRARYIAPLRHTQSSHQG